MSPTFRRSIFGLSRIEGLEPYRQRLFARRTRALCRRAGRRGVRRRSLSRRGRRRAGRARHRRIAGDPARRRRSPANSSRAGRPSRPIVRKGYGDVDAAFRAAHAVVALTLSIGRHSGVPLETRGAIARYDAARDVLELHGAAKVPHWNRDQIARMLGRAAASVQLFEGHVGGGFGIRGEIYPEDVLVCAAALRLRRPVKWIEDRREHLIAANHSRQQQHHVRAAVDRDGRILAHRRRDLPRSGRLYAHPRGDRARSRRRDAAGPLSHSGLSRATAHIRLTNKTPCGTYRAPGRFESTFVRERLIDAIAAQARLDPVEVRRRNLIASERNAVRASARHARHRYRSRFRRLCRPARQGAGRGRMGATARDAGCAPRRRRTGRRRPRPVRREERARAVRSGARSTSIPTAWSRS